MTYILNVIIWYTIYLNKPIIGYVYYMAFYLYK